MDESHRHYTEQKKLNSKKSTYCVIHLQEVLKLICG